MSDVLGTSIYSQDEDHATKVLAHVLANDSLALKAFVHLATPGESLQQDWEIQTQVETDRGHAIDLLLLNGNQPIIVEVKIRDGIRAYQFDPYSKYVERKYGVIPKLTWLVKKPRQVFGTNAKNAVIVTWNQLLKSLEVSTNSETVRFCQQLKQFGIANLIEEHLPASSLQPRSVRILEAIQEQIGGLEGGVEENTRTPISLHVGRKEWNMHWNRRVWFYYQYLGGLRQQTGPFGFVCHLILYNKTMDEFCPDRLFKWSQIMNSHNLRFERNVHGKWNRGFEIHAPIRIETKVGLTGAFAERIPKMEINFDTKSDVAVIEAGVHYLNWGLNIIDECIAG